WCLAIATAAHWLGLSYAIGAVIAGISLATSPIALYIADNLKPLRDFFLVLFFFTVGAGINIAMLATLWAPVSILAIVLVLLKPPVFRWVLQNQSTPKPVAKEVGVRLGQASEFSLLVSYVAISAGLISTEAAFVLEAATVLTLLLSSYWVVTRYPSPVATDPALRRD
ncbi:MAG TPA: sodium:proton antiporter, partial [Gammaproteobacteria bacterium]|nr:sodium:proton antiporter [Gammaproteobacteria bacterium]